MMPLVMDSNNIRNITIRNESSYLNKRLVLEYLTNILEGISKVINEKRQIRFSRWHDLFNRHPTLDIIELTEYVRFWEKIKRDCTAFSSKEYNSQWFKKNLREPLFRSQILAVIPKNYPKKAYDILKIMAHFEGSFKVLLSLLKFVKNSYSHDYDKFMEIILNRISNYYGIGTKKESLFIFDIHVLISKKMKDIGLCIDIIRIKVKEGHIIAFEAPWCELEKLPDSIGMLSHLEHLDLSDNKLTSLPKTFKFLSKLKTLNLSCNNFSDINLDYITRIVKKHYIEKYIKQGVIISEAIVLGILEIFRYQALEKIDWELDSLEWLNYFKINELGYITRIYINVYGSENISIKQICSLKYLEELYIRSIDKIPDYIEMPNSLKILDLRGNPDTIKIPESLKKRKNLKIIS